MTSEPYPEVSDQTHINLKYADYIVVTGVNWFVTMQILTEKQHKQRKKERSLCKTRLRMLPARCPARSKMLLTTQKSGGSPSHVEC